MRKAGAILLATLLVIPPSSLPAFAATSAVGGLGGVVRDDTGRLIEGVEITAQSDGKVVARGLTNAKGEYTLGCLPTRQYRLALNPLRTGLKGQTVVGALGEKGLTVNWTSSSAKPAVAFAKDPAPGGPGVCKAGGGELANPGEVALGALLGTVLIAGATFGGLEAAGVFDKNNKKKASSPSQ